MKPVKEITVNVDELLSVNKYEVDEENAHIELVEEPSDEEFRKLVLLCPAALYKIDEEGNKTFDYASCRVWNTASANPLFRSCRARPPLSTAGRDVVACRAASRIRSCAKGRLLWQAAFRLFAVRSA